MPIPKTSYSPLSNRLFPDPFYYRSLEKEPESYETYKILASTALISSFFAIMTFTASKHFSKSYYWTRNFSKIYPNGLAILKQSSDRPESKTTPSVINASSIFLSSLNSIKEKNSNFNDFNGFD